MIEQSQNEKAECESQIQYIVGIDAGANGAFATYSLESKGYTIHSIENIEILKSFKPDAIAVYLEYLHSSPAMSPKSAFSFGKNVGLILGYLSGLGVKNINFVMPKKWKQHFNLIGKDKNASIAHPIVQTFANAYGLKLRHDEADALLLARYGFDTMTGAKCG